MNAVNNIVFFEAASKVLKALGHPERLKIIELLQTGEQTVGRIQQGIGLSQPVTSQHLRFMQNNNILASRKEGTSTYYSLASDMIRKLLECMNSCRLDLETGEMQMKDIFPESKRSTHE